MLRRFPRVCSRVVEKMLASQVPSRTLSGSRKTVRDTKSIERQAHNPQLDKIWSNIYAADGNVDKLNGAYKVWAKDYDSDLCDKAGCDNQLQTALELRKYVTAGKVLDIGCGTGIVGEKVQELGMKDIVMDGFDPSQEMLDVSQTKAGAYNKLWVAELGPPLDGVHTDSYDAAVCVGVFTHGHCGPEAFHECVRAVKPGGYFIFTVREDLYVNASTGFQAEMQKLEASGWWKLLNVSEPMQLLPKLEPSALYRLFTAQILPGKRPEPSEQFVEAVARLATTPPGPERTIDHRFEYDSPGSILFERYCREYTLQADGSIEGYYLSHCEMEALSRRPLFSLGAGEGAVSEIVELGPSSGRKINLILKGCGEAETPTENLIYRPIDISPNALTMAKNDVLAEFPHVDVRPKQGDFFQCLEDLAKESAGRSHPRAIIMLGSTIGNYETAEEMVDFLRQLRRGMNPGDRLFVGTDMHKDDKVLLSAYNSGPANTRWWVNVIRRLNNEFGASPPLDTTNEAWTTASVYQYEGDDQPNYMDYNIKSLRQQTATLTYPPSLAGTAISFGQDEVIRIGRGCKFTEAFTRRVCAQAGLRVAASHTDSRGYFNMCEMQLA